VSLGQLISYYKSSAILPWPEVAVKALTTWLPVWAISRYDSRVMNKGADDWSVLSASLREKLKTVARRLTPFPSFLSMVWLQAVEVELPLQTAPVSNGCIVVCPDGELYELILRLIPGPDIVGDPEPNDELLPLDLPPEDYHAYAQAAIDVLSKILDQQEDQTKDKID
jgi:hypothetical protein